MSNIYDQATLAREFSGVISGIENTRPLLLFPVRLETHYRESLAPASSTVGSSQKSVGGGDKKKSVDLCVRIFPDEILLDYHNEKLTPQEIADGKFFWLQWFIASGSDTREFEAWQVLCSKYDVDKASLIARLLRPENLDFYMNRRPYLRIVEVEDAVHGIYELLSDTLLDEDLKKQSITERKIEKNLQDVDDCLSVIVNCVRNAEWVVDYLYDQIISAISYLENRIRLFTEFYSKYRDRLIGDLQAMELWDRDYNELIGMEKRVSGIASEFDGRRISLADMVNMYLEDKKNIYVFPKVDVENSDYPAAPKSDVFPERFVLFAETTSGQYLTRYGNPVKKDLALGLVPSEDMNEGVKMDSDGNLTEVGKVNWMVDYEEAESSGMAITLPNVGNQSFKYIYVLGLRRTLRISGYSFDDQEKLGKLFSGHNYIGEGLSFVHKGTPTNEVDGAAPIEDLSEDEIMRIRYDIEVLERFKDSISYDNDAAVLSNALGLNYDETLGRVAGYQGSDLHESAVAMKSLWTKYVSDRISDDCQSSFKTFMKEVGDFFAKYVRAAGVYPTLRVGNNPYGIIPVTDYMAALESIIDDGSQSESMKFLYYSICKLGAKWQKLRDSSVTTVTKSTAEPEKVFLETASQNARSVDYSSRTLVKSTFLEDQPAQNQEYLGISDPYFSSTLLDDEKDFDLSEMVSTVKESLPDITDGKAADLVGEFIDVMSYRLDAWYTAMVRYMAVQKNRPSRYPAIGAYGWAFNLKRNARKVHPSSDAIAAKMKLPEGTTIMKEDGEKRGEYILAPSVQHAITAAVLRSSYLGAKGKGKDSRLCVNLSSTRARQALRILECIKDGMATSVVLGTEFERYLHDVAKNTKYEKEMDKFIYPMRKLYPQSVDIFSPNDSRAKNYTMNVINAESLLNSIISESVPVHWTGNERLSSWLMTNFDEISPLNELKNLPECNDYELLHTLCELIERLYDSYDALNDLLLGEGVYRLVAGDKASFAAISNFMAKGVGNVPSPAILDTPLEYVAVAHKAGLALPRPSGKALSVLANAEPSVDQWVGDMIGSTGNIVFWVEITDESGKVQLCKSNLRDMDIDPIEYLYASSSEHAFANLLEIKWRNKNRCRTAKLRILTGDASELPEGEILDKDFSEFSIYEDSMRINDLRALVVSSRPMRASDFAPGKDLDEEKATDIEDLKSRLESTKSYLRTLESRVNSLADLAADGEFIDDETLSDMYSCIATAIECGLYNASLPYRPEIFISQYNLITERLVWDKCVEVQKQFLASFKSIATIIADKFENCKKVKLVSSESYCEAIRKLVADSFKVLPKFKLDGQLEEEDMRIFSASVNKEIEENFQNVNAQVIENWVEEIAQVRSGMKTWENLSMFELAAGIEVGKPVVFQVKADRTAGIDWLGTVVSAESELDDADSVVVLSGNNMSASGYNSGLVIDSWIEYIPYMKHTAGMAIHVDQPDAEAPQAILMAIYPSFGGATNNCWNFLKIREIMDSTRFVMQNRAVDPEIIRSDKDLSQILPLLNDSVIHGYAGIGGSLRSFTLKQKEYVAQLGKDIFDNMPGGSNLGKTLK